MRCRQPRSKGVKVARIWTEGRGGLGRGVAQPAGPLLLAHCAHRETSIHPPLAPPSRCSRTTKACRPWRRCVCPLPTIPPAASPPLLPPLWRSHVTPPNHGRCRLAAARAVLRPPHPPLPTLPQRRRVRRPRGLPPRVALWRADGPSPRVPRRPAAAAAAGCLPAPDERITPVGGTPPPASRGGRLARRRHVGDCRRRRGTAVVTEATPPLRGGGCGRARRRARTPILVGLGPLRRVRARRRGVHPRRLRRASAGRVTAHHAVPAERSVPF